MDYILPIELFGDTNLAYFPKIIKRFTKFENCFKFTDMKNILLLVIVSMFTLTGWTNKDTVLLVSDYVVTDGSTDVADAIQKIIDENPNRTIYFPDGTYMLSHPIVTPADPKRSVHLELSNYAILKAAEGWKEGEAIVKLGGSHPFNNIMIVGSNYGLNGGIIDGSNVADGISIDGGRETRIKEVSIKHTRIGIHIKHGANSGSSDSDIVDVNIVGNNMPNSIGLLIEGFDNTFTNMRIYAVNKGVWCKTGGNSFRNIHPLFKYGEYQDYNSGCGFVIEAENNFLNYCYSDQFATGFKLVGNGCYNLTDYFCFWYTDRGQSQTAIEADGKFNSMVSSIRIGFHPNCSNITVLKVKEEGGKGKLLHTILPNREFSPSDVSAQYLL